MKYLSIVDDPRQDQEIGDLRGYVRKLVGARSVIEIGPSYSPLFPRRDGFDVTIVDHADAGALREKYSALGVDPSAIEDVDYVWQGGSISELVGGRTFDFLFASHLIEHTTDFVRFLQDCERLVGDGGSTLLIVPDKRYCFDLFQPITDTAKVLSDYERRQSRHTFESLYREESQVSVDYEGVDRLAWWQGEVSSVKLMRRDPARRVASVRQALASSEYADAHEYFFTPSSFLLIAQELRLLGLVNLEVDTLTRARGCEFLAVLKRAGSRLSVEDFLEQRRELGLNILREQIEAWSKVAPVKQAI